ncbi:MULTISPECIES: hypothetical protein [unclassified Leeuwenhoekiella]|uniref:toxin-antitoxin system YwqK family antitoxin n=1 Tax=unclassified Leeuwenhoekiella TaxID=2615029 RepID=UPI000C612407|nr:MULTISPECIES: hypothetical protein [unclassified Leeuwenhoekiella]MBA80473.1 hypothetical protein [Leeuwenhoekiella sp.]|tara:strand:+ start:61924 stop:62394 length:471 start_codon:yes stop_codon:yes gene_type:complete
MLLRLGFLFLSAVGFSQSGKHYVKYHDASGRMMEEGWMLQDEKTDYWFTYFPDGSIKSKGAYTEDQKNGYWYFYNTDATLIKEGHYKNGLAVSWWIFYKPNGISEKIQFEHGNREGYALIYKNGKLFKAEHYKNDNLTGSWTSLYQFKKDNPNARF